MATAKTPPKKIPAAAPAASKTAKPAPAARAAKPVPARAAAAKPVEDAVVHSAEIAAGQGGRVANAAAAQAANLSETAAAKAGKVAETVGETVAARAEEAAAIVQQAAVNPPKAVALVEQAAGRAGDHLSAGIVPLLDFGRENAILLVATGNEFALGLHKLSHSLLDWSAESCDKSVAAGQAMLSAKTVEEVVDLSHNLARDGLQQLLKEGEELSALSSKLLEDTLVPLPARLVDAAFRLASHHA